MGFQSGVWYFDGRQIDASETVAISGWAHSGSRPPQCASPEPGVLLAHSDAGSLYRRHGNAIGFEGRLDNRQDLRLRLRDLLDADRGDAALTAAGYEMSGAEGLAQMIGDWSLTIWDASRRALLLASDFAGVRPLYYTVQKNRVLWSTRLRPLVDWLPDAGIDDGYVAGLLACGGAPNRTPYRNVYSVPPGHYVEVTAGGTRIAAFWKLPIGDTIRYRSEPEYEEHLRWLFREAVRVRCQHPAVLSELSGGLDSSSIVCMAAEMIRGGEIPTERLETISVAHEGSRDQPFYIAVANACGLHNHVLPAAEYPFLPKDDSGGVSPEFWPALNRQCAALAASTGAGAYVTGLLGDLVMGNWDDDSGQVAGMLLAGHIGLAFEQGLAWSKVLGVPLAAVLWNALRHQNRYQSNGWHEAPEVEDSITPAFRKRALPSGGADPFSQDWKHARPERRKHFRSVAQMLEQGRLRPPEALEHLQYVHPYAHRPLVTFMLSIPAEIVCGPGQPRRLMRRALDPLWPPILRKRRSKDGFGGVFLDSLRPIAHELSKPGQRLLVVENGYVDPGSLGQRLDRLSLSLKCNEPQLRQILLLELWLRQRQSRSRLTPVAA